MRHSFAPRALPALLLLMAIAVILILSGSTGFGFAFGLTVAGIAGIVLVAALVNDLAHGEARHQPRRNGLYQRPDVRGY